ncbi:hypothetical protein DB895_14100, partial [Flavobacterium psychrotolerans]
RIRDPYVRWCERRSPSVSGGPVYSITSSLKYEQIFYFFRYLFFMFNFVIKFSCFFFHFFIFC